MKITLGSLDISKKKTAMVCAFVPKNSKYPKCLKIADKRVSAAVGDAALQVRDKLGHTATVSTLGLIKPKSILLVGLGDARKNASDATRFAAGCAIQSAKDMKLREFCIADDSGDPDTIRQIVEGAILTAYSFDQYRDRQRWPDLVILTRRPAAVKNTVRQARMAADGAIFARQIANMPPNDCTPDVLAKIARKLAASNKLRCSIVSGAALKKQGFGGIVAVGQGSRNTPRLITLEYNGRRGQKPVVVVGKAVTFDTGGISIKPGERMDEMKFDKCGGCAVLGILKAASELRLPVNLVGVIPSVENMPGGDSYRPGDIIRLYGGKTAEIINTDAEGRLILADAISYAQRRYSPRAIIDLATLTGACIVALGANVAGMISDSDSLAKGLLRSSENTSEQIWRLPINDDYMDMIKSKYADIKNMGIGRTAGTIAAAAFLKSAVDGVPWAHLDIAGTAWTQTGTKKKPYNPHGATGFGVRLVLDYLQNS